MEKYKEKLKMDNRLLIISSLVLAVFSITFALAEAQIIPFPAPIAGDSHWQSRWRGFCSGASSGVLGLLIFFLIRNIRALRSEEKIKKLYIQENDERTKQVSFCARDASFRTFLIAGIVGTIISGYFSITVCITILACTLFCTFSYAFFCSYYSKKY